MKAESNPIIAALEVSTVEMALKLAEEIRPAVGAFKIGSELFTTGGPEIVRRIRGSGASVFLDLKFHDIPNTVAKAVAVATRLDVQMLTIHASGGVGKMGAGGGGGGKKGQQRGLEKPVIPGVEGVAGMGRRAANENCKGGKGGGPSETVGGV